MGAGGRGQVAAAAAGIKDAGTHMDTFRFKASIAKAIIGDVLTSKLAGVQYDPALADAWARDIAQEIKQRLKAEDWPRYRIVVQALIGEQRGEGCRMGCRCFWDDSSDNHACGTMFNASLYAVAVAFAVWMP